MEIWVCEVHWWKWLIVLGLWRGRGKKEIKNPVLFGSRMGPDGSRVGPVDARGRARVWRRI